MLLRTLLYHGWFFINWTVAVSNCVTRDAFAVEYEWKWTTPILCRWENKLVLFTDKINQEHLLTWSRLSFRFDTFVPDPVAISSAINRTSVFPLPSFSLEWKTAVRPLSSRALINPTWSTDRPTAEWNTKIQRNYPPPSLEQKNSKQHYLSIVTYVFSAFFYSHTFSIFTFQFEGSKPWYF